MDRAIGAIVDALRRGRQADTGCGGQSSLSCSQAAFSQQQRAAPGAPWLPEVQAFGAARREDAAMIGVAAAETILASEEGHEDVVRALAERPGPQHLFPLYLLLLN